jgi:6,7-dimethyl-8-ribityllumazine synthase
MPQFHEGALDGQGLRVAVVVSRFNDMFTERLLQGALDCLQRHGIDDETVQVARVPGAFEIPVCARVLARSGRFDTVICLGAVIRGATPHFEFISSQVAAGCSQVALETGVPVVFGVLTTDTLEQAMERSGSKSGNKGWEAALAAIETANLLRDLRREDG